MIVIPEYNIYVALHEETNEGWVWTNEVQYSKSKYIEIKNGKRKIISRVRFIDENFRAQYNAHETTRHLHLQNNVLVISTHYRDKLGIGKNVICNLDTREIKYCGATLTMKYHPNDVVRSSYYLGVISVTLGVVGVILGFLGLVIGILGFIK